MPAGSSLAGNKKSDVTKIFLVNLTCTQSHQIYSTPILPMKISIGVMQGTKDFNQNNPCLAHCMLNITQTMFMKVRMASCLWRSQRTQPVLHQEIAKL
jgi:hypothetical protein